MALGNLLSTASVIVALATFAGLALQRGIVTSLREQVGDYKGRVEFLETERTEDKSTITRQASDIAALQRIVTGEVHWTSISDLLEHHHKAAQENWRRGEELLEEIRDNTRGVK